MASLSLIALLSSSYILLSSSPLVVVDAFGVTNTHPLRNLHNSHIGNRRHGQWGSALPTPTLNLNLSPSFLPTIGDNHNAKRTSGSSLAMADSNEGKDSPTPPSAKTTVLLLAFVALITKTLSSTTALSAIAPTAGAICVGDTAWMLVATSFVLLMTPGLALFEAGLLRAKNTISVITQCFSGLSILSILWAVVGYSMCFGATPILGGILSNPMDHLMLKGIGWSSSLANAPTIPGMLFASFQCMFAAITPLLVTGAFAERLKLKGFLTFSVLWSVLCYYPMCHSVWGGGWLAKKGVLDFAGGIVIHAIAGVASLVTAHMLGPRKGTPEESSIPLATVGAGLLWMGWFGFNAGSSVAAGALAANTLLVSHLAACAGSAVWMALDWTTGGKPTLVGILNGALSGLAGVTPASGFVHAPSGMAIGALCGLASYYGVYFLKEKGGIDDALDVSSVHGITGIVGSLAIGLFGSLAINPDGANGLFFGGGTAQLVKQALGVAVACGWSLVTTFGIMKLLNKLGWARVDDDVESTGIDADEHGEAAYQM